MYPTSMLLSAITPNQYSWPACSVNENGWDITQDGDCEAARVSIWENTSWLSFMSQIMYFRSPPLGMLRYIAIPSMVVVWPTITPWPGPESEPHGDAVGGAQIEDQGVG